MRLSRFFTERKKIRVGSSVKLNDSDDVHIRKVLRLKKGDEIILFNGESEYLAELNIVRDDLVTANVKEIYEQDPNNMSNKTEITLFQSLLRSGKFDYIIEKTTELGISNIVPVETEFSQTKIDVAQRKKERWQKVLIAAAKQCERITIPTIFDPIKFEQIKDVVSEFDLVYFFTIPREKVIESLEAKNLKNVAEGKEVENVKKIAYIIGPEGGFSPTEHKLAKEWGVKFVKFGDTVLKSDTAAVALLAVLKYMYE